MYIFPLITRELYAAQRRRSTRRLRIGFGAGTMLFVTWGFLVWQGTGLGAVMFVVLAGVALIGIFLAALLLASDIVSREKREGTLGFLFLTDLRASEIVIGKLAASAVVPFFTLMAMFPSFAFCQLLGGVMPEEFWRVMLGLLVSLIASLSMSLFVSSHCVQRRSAYAASGLLLCVANPGWWLVFFAFDNAGAYRGVFWLLLALTVVAIVTLLWWASVKVEKDWRDKELRIVKSVAVEEAFTISENRVRRVDEKKPVAWLVARSRNPATALWAIGMALAAMVALWLRMMGTAPWSKTLASELMFAGIFLVAHLLIKVILLSKTSHQLFADRQDGNLELLLATPLGTEEIFAGFQTALQKQFRRPILFVMICDVVSASFFFMQGNRASFAVAACCILIWPEFVSLTWTGVWRVLMANHVAVGLLGSAIRVVLVPLIVGSLALTVFHGGKPVEFAFLWVLGNLAVSAFFFIHAKAALLKHGRTLLLRPYGEKPPNIESDWSAMNWEEEATEGAAKMAEGSGDWSAFNWEDESATGAKT